MPGRRAPVCWPHRVAAGRIAATVRAFANLFLSPFGTTLGIDAMWVLLDDEAGDDRRALRVNSEVRGNGAVGGNGINTKKRSNGDKTERVAASRCARHEW